MTSPTDSPPSIRIVIADDNPQFRSVLRRLLDRETDIVVVAEAANGSQAIDHARHHVPDIILMDVSMPELDGITATARLMEHDPHLPVVLLSVGSKTQEVSAGLASGAREYLVKGTAASTIIDAVRRHARKNVPQESPAR